MSALIRDGRVYYETARPQRFTATEPGALDGWETTCSCGLVLRSSLSKDCLQSDVLAHMAWHAEQEGPRR